MRSGKARSAKRRRNPPKSARSRASETDAHAPSGSVVSACRKISASPVAMAAPRLNWRERIGSHATTFAPRAAAISAVRSRLVPSATTISSAPAARAESMAAPIEASSFSAAMMTDTFTAAVYALPVNCYVLTGGRSTRMGRSKAEMFLDRVAAAATPVFDRVIAVQRFGQDPTSIETIFEEAHPGAAPVFGVVCALQHARAKCFILATDLPLITTPFLRALRFQFERSKAPALVPRWRGELQPLCAGYSPAVLPMLERRISEGKLDLLGLAATEAAIVDVSGDELTNVNTPEDAERLK